jgi:hypothetical protein
MHRRAVDSALSGARQIGTALIRVKSRLRHGEFQPWVERHCDFSYRSATNYIQVAEHWDQIEERLGPNRQRAADLSIRAALSLVGKLSDAASEAGSSRGRPLAARSPRRDAVTLALRRGLARIAREFGAPDGDHDQLERVWDECRELREQAAALLRADDPRDWLRCPVCADGLPVTVWACDACRNAGFSLPGDELWVEPPHVGGGADTGTRPRDDDRSGGEETHPARRRRS